MCTAGAWLTFLFHAGYATHSWLKVLRRSTTGSQTRAGSPFTLATNNQRELKHAVWLLRLSYLRYALRADEDPRGLLERESQELYLSPEFKSLFDRFVPATANRGAA